MNDLRDNLIIVTLCRNGHPKDKETYDRYIGRAKDVAMKNHIPVFRIYTDFVQVEDDVAGALCSLSNAHANGSSILVLGAAGKGDEDKNGRRPEGQPPMGSIATKVLTKIKVPVLLVKAGAKLDLEVPRVKRQGRDSTPGLNIMVSIDGSAVSERAFDLACKVSTKLDTLYVYHVQTDEDTSGLMKEMRHACDKLLDAKKVAHAGVIAVPKTRNSIREMIEEFVEVKAVDILFMGSGETHETRVIAQTDTTADFCHPSLHRVCFLTDATSCRTPHLLLLPSHDAQSSSPSLRMADWARFLRASPRRAPPTAASSRTLRQHERESFLNLVHMGTEAQFPACS